jgi:hypothetical protein
MPIQKLAALEEIQHFAHCPLGVASGQGEFGLYMFFFLNEERPEGPGSIIFTMDEYNITKDPIR